MSDYPGKYHHDDTAALREMIKEDATTITQQRKDMETLVEAVLLVDEIWDWETLTGITKKDAQFFQEACAVARKVRGKMTDKGKTTVTEAVVTMVKQAAAKEEFRKWCQYTDEGRWITAGKLSVASEKAAYLAGRKARQEQDARIAENKQISMSCGTLDTVVTYNKACRDVLAAIRAQK